MRNQDQFEFSLSNMLSKTRQSFKLYRSNNFWFGCLMPVPNSIQKMKIKYDINKDQYLQLLKLLNFVSADLFLFYKKSPFDQAFKLLYLIKGVYGLNSQNQLTGFSGYQQKVAKVYFLNNLSLFLVKHRQFSFAQQCFQLILQLVTHDQIDNCSDCVLSALSNYLTFLKSHQSQQIVQKINQVVKHLYKTYQKLLNRYLVGGCPENSFMIMCSVLKQHEFNLGSQLKNQCNLLVKKYRSLTYTYDHSMLYRNVDLSKNKDALSQSHRQQNNAIMKRNRQFKRGELQIKKTEQYFLTSSLLFSRKSVSLLPINQRERYSVQLQKNKSEDQKLRHKTNNYNHENDFLVIKTKQDISDTTKVTPACSDVDSSIQRRQAHTPRLRMTRTKVQAQKFEGKLETSDLRNQRIPYRQSQILDVFGPEEHQNQRGQYYTLGPKKSNTQFISQPRTGQKQEKQEKQEETERQETEKQENPQKSESPQKYQSSKKSETPKKFETPKKSERSHRGKPLIKFATSEKKEAPQKSETPPKPEAQEQRRVQVLQRFQTFQKSDTEKKSNVEGSDPSQGNKKEEQQLQSNDQRGAPIPQIMNEPPSPIFFSTVVRAPAAINAPSSAAPANLYSSSVHTPAIVPARVPVNVAVPASINASVPAPVNVAGTQVSKRTKKIDMSQKIVLKVGQCILQVTRDGIILSDFLRQNRKYLPWQKLFVIIQNLRYSNIFSNYLPVQSFYDVARILIPYIYDPIIQQVIVQENPRQILELDLFTKLFHVEGKYLKLFKMNRYDNNHIQFNIDCYIDLFEEYFEEINKNQYLENLNCKVLGKNIKNLQHCLIANYRKCKEMIVQNFASRLKIQDLEEVPYMRSSPIKILMIMRKNVELFVYLRQVDLKELKEIEQWNQYINSELPLSVIQLNQEQKKELSLKLPLYKLCKYFPIVQKQLSDWMHKYGRFVIQGFRRCFQDFPYSFNNLQFFDARTYAKKIQLLPAGKYLTPITAQIIGSNYRIWGICIRHFQQSQIKEKITFIYNPYFELLSPLIGFKQQQRKKVLLDHLIDGKITATYKKLGELNLTGTMINLLNYWKIIDF